ncbi:hypothetical protein CR513_58598, partial [Mucuna pruriens]
MAKDKVITLGPNELPNLVSSYHLDGCNYLQWAQYICTTLKGRKKLSHIEGNGLPRDDPKFEAWDDEDSLIMTWLWNSDFGNKLKLYIWENLIETYSMKEGSAACYDIESKIFNSRQGTLSVIEYYGTLNGLWIELDQYQGLKMCKADSVAYTRLVERGRIFKFLHDLNFEYDPIRVQILETRRSIMLDKGNSNTGSAMVTRKGATKGSTSEEKPFTRRHTKDTCYKRYGKEKVLERMGGNKGSTQMWVNQTTSNKENRVEHPSPSQLDQDIQAFSKKEMDRLRALPNSTSLLVHVV